MDANRPTALVIDDNKDSQLIFKTILEGIGFDVIGQQDPIQGLATLRTQTFNLLILDLSMPKLSGNSILRQIRPSEQHKDMVVIVVTAHAHMALGDEIDVAADYTMLKPISATDFARFVTKIVAKHAGISNKEP